MNASIAPETSPDGDPTAISNTSAGLIARSKSAAFGSNPRRSSRPSHSTPRYVRPSLSRARLQSDVHRLVAYLVLAAGQPAPPDLELRQFLRTSLTEPMIPSAFVVLESLPLTHNGKVDRESLPAPESLSLRADALFVAPSGPLEEEVASIWSAVLGLDRIGSADNFFDLGGHSLLATQVISRLCETTGLEIPLRALFESPTVAAMATRIETAQRAECRSENVPIKPGDA